MKPVLRILDRLSIMLQCRNYKMEKNLIVLFAIDRSFVDYTQISAKKGSKQLGMVEMSLINIKIQINIRTDFTISDYKKIKMKM